MHRKDRGADRRVDAEVQRADQERLAQRCDELGCGGVDRVRRSQRVG